MKALGSPSISRAPMGAGGGGGEGGGAEMLSEYRKLVYADEIHLTASGFSSEDFLLFVCFCLCFFLVLFFFSFFASLHIMKSREKNKNSNNLRTVEQTV